MRQSPRLRRLPLLLGLVLALFAAFALTRSKARSVETPRIEAPAVEVELVAPPSAEEPEAIEPKSAGVTSRVPAAREESRAARPAERAELEVIATAKPHAIPIRGLRVAIRRAGEAPGGWTPIERPKARGEREAPLTNEEGWAAFPVEAGVTYVLRAWFERDVSPAIEREVEPLPPGERVPIELEFDARLDLALRGRIVDEATRLPILGAHIRLHLPDVDLDEDEDEGVEPEEGGLTIARVETDAGGGFELGAPSWCPSQISVEAAGFAPQFVRLDETTPAPSALELALLRTASLDVRVLGGSGDACVVSVDAHGCGALAPGSTPRRWVWSPSFSWTARIDEEGRARFEGLPPGCPLRVVAACAGRYLESPGGDPRLEPGELRDLVIDFTGASTIRGVLAFGGDGSPVVGARIGLQPSRAEEDAPSRGATRFASVSTDSTGRFAFEGVPAGDWWIEPETTEGPDRVADFAALPVRVHVDEGELDLELTASRALYLHGRVEDPEHRPSEPRSVHAVALGSGHEAFAVVDRAGAFRIGPLQCERYSVYAEAPGRRTVPTVAEAGEEAALVLRFDPGVMLVVSTEVAGAPVARDGELLLTRRRDDALGAVEPWSNWWKPLSEYDEGRIELGPVHPGRYDLVVTTKRGEFGSVPELEVRLGGAEPAVAVELHPGARLAFSATPDLEWMRVEVERTGALVASGGLGRDRDLELVVPPGELRLRFVDERERVVEERRISVLAGERVEVDPPRPR